MLKDRYDNPISTTSATARDAYVRGVDLLLSATPGSEVAFAQAIAADEGFALAHIALARAAQAHGRGGEAKAPLARAKAMAAHTSSREQSHIAIFEKILTGQSAAALEATREHVRSWPRDAFALAPSTSVFGLIGFSGKAGREAEQLALLEPLQPVYGDDWWYRTVLAFAQIELQLHDPGLRNIDAALAANPRNAHAAHIRAHLYYEMGEREAGLAFLRDWAPPYPREGQLHCHVSWHMAIWSLETGRREDAWKIYRESLHPGSAWGPQINVLTDCAAFLHRAELAGEARQPQLWRDISAYARQWFPAAGISFADVHAALAHAMAGEGDALGRLADCGAGPAADMVAPIARGFAAFARGEWATVIAALEPTLGTHERIGGSRAQRDLIEYTLVAALLRSGRGQEAHRMLTARRPQNMAPPGVPIAGF